MAGAERLGIAYHGGLCSRDVLPVRYTHFIGTNKVFSSLVGVAVHSGMVYKNVKCVRIAGFTVFKSNIFGAYYQAKVNVSFENNIFIDNQIGAYAIVAGNSLTTHQLSKKSIVFMNNLIIGLS